LARHMLGKRNMHPLDCSFFESGLDDNWDSAPENGATILPDPPAPPTTPPSAESILVTEQERFLHLRHPQPRTEDAPTIRPPTYSCIIASGAAVEDVVDADLDSDLRADRVA
jgi:hypothetical protein